MAEVVGLAASIAGLIGLTGQIGKSALFIKGFLDDTKNAPEEVRSLASEVEMLSAAAKSTDALLVTCHAKGLFSDLEEERKGLVRYADMIERLKGKIEKDVKTFGAGNGRWWEKVGSATRKKSVEKYLVGVERAKTFVLGIESKISIQLQQRHDDSIATTNQFLDTLNLSFDKSAAVLIKIESQTTQLKTWTDDTDQVLVQLSNGIQQLNTGLTNLVPALQNPDPDPHPQPRSLVELSLIESMLESAVTRGLKRHQQEFQNSGNQNSSNIIIPLGITYEKPEASSLCETVHPDSESYSMICRDKIVFRTEFRTPFFNISIETREAQRTSKRKSALHHDEIRHFKPTHFQQYTKYSVRVKIPFWRGGMTFQSGNPGIIHGGDLCKTFRTYNVVPDNAPIVAACKNFDLPAVRRLFETGLASPFDVTGKYQKSLIDTVMASMTGGYKQISSSADPISLLRYLICCLSGDIGGVEEIFHIIWVIDNNRARFHVPMNVLTEACRLAINHSSEDPFTGVEHCLSIRLAASPIYNVLFTQDVWWMDDTVEHLNEDRSETRWFETDLQMLKDEKALALQAALAKGLGYVPFNAHLGEAESSCIHCLLLLSSRTTEVSFHRCVLNRLVILLKHGLDPREVSRTIDFEFEWDTLDTNVPFSQVDRPLSCTEFALVLDLESLWRRSLEEAGWSHLDIDELFEEDLRQAINLLLNGEIQYQTRDDQRKSFLEDLRVGEFVHLVLNAQYRMSIELQIQLRLHWNEILSMMIEVQSIFKARSTPGSWIDEQDVRLMPGRDFEIPHSCYNTFSSFEDWKCILDVWDAELDGWRPDGFLEREERRRHHKRSRQQ